MLKLLFILLTFVFPIKKWFCDFGPIKSSKVKCNQHKQQQQIGVNMMIRISVSIDSIRISIGSICCNSRCNSPFLDIIVNQSINNSSSRINKITMQTCMLRTSFWRMWPRCLCLCLCLRLHLCQCHQCQYHRHHLLQNAPAHHLHPNLMMMEWSRCLSSDLVKRRDTLWKLNQRNPRASVN